MTDPEQSFVTVRLDEATEARIDALVPQLSEEWQVTRSDALLRLLLTALEEAENDPEQFDALHRAQR